MKYYTLTILIVLLILSGCKKMDDFQINPNAASVAVPSMLLTSLENNLFQFSSISSSGTNEGSFYYALSTAIQYNVGFSTHSILTQSHQWETNTMNEYLQIRDAMEMISSANGNKSYIALGKLFIAINYYSLTNKFGDVPCTEAMKLSDGINTPSYDSQKSVYETIISNLDSANYLLSLQQGAIKGDFIYSGNISKWQKFVNSFRLRVILSLSNKTGSDLNPKSLFANVMSDPAKYPVFSSNDDNAQQITNTVTPFTFYNNPELVYYGLAKAFTDSLVKYKDPRIIHWANRTDSAVKAGLSVYDYNSYNGLPADASNSVNTANASKASAPNSNYFSQANYEPNLFMGFYEVNFLVAEGIVRGWWDGGDAESYYNQGISSSLSYYSIPNDTINRYLSGSHVSYKSQIGLNQILFQKYIAQVYNSGYEPYFAQRRTGFPVLAVSGPGVPNHKEALRWQYPVTEYTLNKDKVNEAVTRQYSGGDIITEKMWLLIPE